MSEQRIIRYLSKSSRRRGAAVLLTAVVCSTTVMCQLVIGDLPLEAQQAVDAGPIDAPDRSPADVAPDTSATDAAQESRTDVEAEAQDADLGEADALDSGSDAEPCTGIVTWYADDDEDGYGRVDERVMACPKPPGGWARNSGDCYDGNPWVHPGQTEYFGDPFDVPGGAKSFDYDCSGGEDGDPLQKTALPDCGVLSLLLCDASGYALTPRVGPGINGYCGSRVLTTCRPVAGILICQSVSEEVDTAYRCR